MATSLGYIGPEKEHSMVKEFVRVTKSDPDLAKFFLHESNWDLAKAFDVYYASVREEGNGSGMNSGVPKRRQNNGNISGLDTTLAYC